MPLAFRLIVRKRGRRTLAGFTLLELLVAISIMATVSLIAWRGLDTLVSTRARLAPEGDEVRALLTAFGQVDRDLAQTINPTLFAFTTSPVTVTTIGGQPALSIMRIAPVEADAPTALQVVGYRVEDGFLVRSASRPMRGRGAVAAEDVTNVRLLERVKSLRLRVWRDNQGWVDPLASDAAAPPPVIPGQTAPLVPPGIEITLERNDGKLFRKVLLVG
jgi:general secretion pathway protein J